MTSGGRQRSQGGTSSLERGLAAVKDIQAEFHLDSLSPQISALSRSLPERHVVNVAVVGRFKAGKSSFLNEIVGCEILPVDVLPATSVITQISYGPVDRALVRYLDGREQGVTLDGLSEYVTEKNNPENVKQVAVVDVQLASLEAFRTVRFVDTPGLGSVFAETTKTSLDWLPDIGAAIVALTVDPPLAESDLRLLRDVLRHTPEVVILLTKVDQVAEDQVRAVEAFIHGEIRKRLGSEIPIYPYSTKPGREHLRARLLDYLVDRVVNHHEERLEEILTHKFHALAGECRDYLALAQTAAEVGESARAELLELTRREQGNLDQVGRAIRVLARDLERRAHDKLAEDYSRLLPGALDSIRADFDSSSRTWKGHLGKTSVAFQEWAEVALRREMGAVLPRGEKYLAPVLAEAESHFKRAVRGFQDRLAIAIETALGTRFSGATFQAEMEPPSFPDVRIDKTFDIPLDMAWFLVPMPVFRRLIYRRLRSQLPWEVEKNLIRLSGQWNEAAKRSIRSIAAQAEEFMRQEAATVIELATSTEDRTQRVKAALARLDEINLRHMADTG
ncbi:MAG: dynamin family protein [Thermoleophilia bacterium]|nr:dynamin family protein [Thermoleophilia bacterium]